MHVPIIHPLVGGATLYRSRPPCPVLSGFKLIRREWPSGYTYGINTHISNGMVVLVLEYSSTHPMDGTLPMELYIIIRS